MCFAELTNRQVLNDRSIVKDGNAVADLDHGDQIVRDVQKRHTVSAVQAPQQIDDLRFSTQETLWSIPALIIQISLRRHLPRPSGGMCS